MDNYQLHLVDEVRSGRPTSHPLIDRRRIRKRVASPAVLYVLQLCDDRISGRGEHA
jgi:hypothetical protein